MSIQRLNAAKRNRISRAVGSPVIMAWTCGNDWREFIVPFRTTEHRHGLWNRRTGEVEWLADIPAYHLSSCLDLTAEYWRRSETASMLRAVRDAGLRGADGIEVLKDAARNA